VSAVSFMHPFSGCMSSPEVRYVHHHDGVMTSIRAAAYTLQNTSCTHSEAMHAFSVLESCLIRLSQVSNKIVLKA